MVGTIHPAPLDYNLWSDILTISVASSSSTFRASAFFSQTGLSQVLRTRALSSNRHLQWVARLLTGLHPKSDIWKPASSNLKPMTVREDSRSVSIYRPSALHQPARAPNTSTFLDLTLKSGLVRCCPIWSPLMSLCPGKGKHFGRGIPPEKLNV